MATDIHGRFRDWVQHLDRKPLLRHAMVFEDAVEKMSGESDQFTPPFSLRVVVGCNKDARSFREEGEERLKHFRDVCSLEPFENVLDVGCGCGMTAVPLTTYLDRSARYEGLDIVNRLIQWDRKHISSRHPNFHFELADVFNKAYNPNGKHRASEYRFPYDNDSFDLVCLFSVFTHMLEKDLGNYLSEISRVLKPGGRCMISYHLTNKDVLRLVDAGQTSLDFRHVIEGYRTVSERVPETAVAYDDQLIRGLYQKVGLAIVEPIHYGSWCCAKDSLGYQDIVVASKK